MAVVEIVGRDGSKVEERAVAGDILDAPVRRHLLYEVVKMQLANRRRGTASTKTRGEVRGGGRKPWRQKGTGRARQGSIRAPQWVGGGVVFGPKPRDYSYRLPKKARKVALKSALSAKYRDGEILFVDRIELPDHKTKSAVAFLRDLGLEDKKVLLVVEELDFNLDRATRNLPRVKVLKVEGLNVYDLLDHEVVVCTAGALSRIEEALA